MSFWSSIVSCIKWLLRIKEEVHAAVHVVDNVLDKVDAVDSGLDKLGGVQESSVVDSSNRL